MTAQVHAMYPWATQIPTAGGGMKNKYNLAQGTTLQPLQAAPRVITYVLGRSRRARARRPHVVITPWAALQALQPLDPDATMRKTAAFAAPLGRS